MRKKKINPEPNELSIEEMCAMRYIETAMLTRIISPTIREIADAVGLSVGATHDVIERLRDYGYLAPKWGTKRRVRNLRVKRSVLG